MSRFIKFADVAGVLGAVFAALCCAGTPFIVAGLAALGLSFMRRDAILWPLMLASLLIALLGFWRGRQMHGRAGPFVVALVSAMVLVAGVIFVHGFPALEMIWTSVAAFIGATAWNVVLRWQHSTHPRL
jgi:mercuric ion transport protein